jgi:hypothetical protein
MGRIRNSRQIGSKTSVKSIKASVKIVKTNIKMRHDQNLSTRLKTQDSRRED